MCEKNDENKKLFRYNEFLFNPSKVAPQKASLTLLKKKKRTTSLIRGLYREDLGQMPAGLIIVKGLVETIS